MPKIVDHDARRTEIVRAFLKLVARDGFDAVTTRALASELGIGAGSLWHYFENFDVLLASAVRETVRNTNERIVGIDESLRGLAALHAIMAEILPMEKVTRDEAHVVVAFWGARRPAVI